MSPAGQGQHSAPAYVPATAKKKKGGGVWRVVFWISLVVFLGALGALGYIGWGYFSADQGYKQVASDAFNVTDTATEDPIERGLSLADLEVDWDYLRSINPDIVAWVYLPGTRINYPVVQGTDNDQYLWTDFNRTTSRCGSIFLDSANNPNFTDANSVLYGHHMNDGSMFAVLSTTLANNEEFNKHRTVYVLTPRLNYQCSSFAMVLTTGTDYLVQVSFKDAEERLQYVQDKMDRSVVQPTEGMPKADEIKQLFTFSTCDYTQDNGRAVMFSQVVDTAVPKSAPAEGEPEHEAVSSGVLEALEEGVAVADQ